jgi:tRNA/tmRNA/rRNA uracil-C5-methylase (TrmA/RlmC/RlmD family)
VGGFWQVHVGAADLLARVVLDLAAVRDGDRCLDLYSGVGLFAGTLAPHADRVTAVESDRRACAAARRNLADLPVTVVNDRAAQGRRQGRRRAHRPDRRTPGRLRRLRPRGAGA